MAVNTKGKRKVNVKGRQYLWYIEDAGGEVVPEVGFVEHVTRVRILHIVSANKRFIVRYQIPLPGEPSAKLFVDGPEFPRLPGARVIVAPRWRHDSKRYPTADFVRRLIGWSLGLEEGS